MTPGMTATILLRVGCCLAVVLSTVDQAAAGSNEAYQKELAKGAAELEAGNYSQAWLAYQKARSKSPEEGWAPDAVMGLVEVDLREGRHEDALREAEGLLDSAVPPAELTNLLGDLMPLLERIGKAEDLLVGGRARHIARVLQQSLTCANGSKPSLVPFEPPAAVLAGTDSSRPTVEPADRYLPMPRLSKKQHRKAGGRFVHVRLEVDAQGCVTSYSWLEGSEPELGTSLAEVLPFWTFKPPAVEGKPVPSSKNIGWKVPKRRSTVTQQASSEPGSTRTGWDPFRERRAGEPESVGRDNQGPP